LNIASQKRSFENRLLILYQGGINLKRLIIISLMLLLPITFCFPIFAEEQGQTTTVYVFNIGVKVSSDVPLYANGLFITVLKPKTYNTFTIDSNKLRLSSYFFVSSGFTMFREQQFSVQPGGKKYFTCKIYASNTFEEINEEQAESYLKEFSISVPTK
jgi:hypothetical protein